MIRIRFHDAEEDFARRRLETILQMERMILQQDRYEVVTARDGQEGVIRPRTKPDLILMDVIMPRLDGFAAVRRLRENQTRAGANCDGDLESPSREHGNRL
jgi:CheY-like chemotaxis protein